MWVVNCVRKFGGCEVGVGIFLKPHKAQLLIGLSAGGALDSDKGPRPDLMIR